jgi:hypothetical protein
VALERKQENIFYLNAQYLQSPLPIHDKAPLSQSHTRLHIDALETNLVIYIEPSPKYAKTLNQNTELLLHF